MLPKQLFSPSFLFASSRVLFLFLFLFASSRVPVGSNMATQKDGILNYIPDSDNTLAPKHAIVTYGRPKSPSLVTVQELDTPAKPHPPTCFPQC